MVEATRVLEEFVLRHPEQWLWMHRRWKPPPNRRKRAHATILAGESA
jgi:KDO2-lipid IV(A) lauroyltransferase